MREIDEKDYLQSRGSLVDTEGTYTPDEGRENSYTAITGEEGHTIQPESLGLRQYNREIIALCPMHYPSTPLSFREVRGSFNTAGSIRLCEASYSCSLQSCTLTSMVIKVVFLNK